MAKLPSASEISKIRSAKGYRLYLQAAAVFFILLCLALLAFLLQFNKQNTHLLKNSMLREAQDIVTILKLSPFFEKVHSSPESPFLLLQALPKEKRQTSLNIRLTSLTPSNTLNEPDLVDIKAIHDLQEDHEDSHRFFIQDNMIQLRYFAPLMTKETCLECHKPSQTTKSSFIGGISITLSDENLIGPGLKRNQITYYSIISVGIIFIFLSFIFILFLIKERRASRNAVQKMANRDFLTDLPNRKEGLRRLGEELSKSLRSNQDLTVILFDIDRFKYVNETLGNAGGDEVLQEVTNTLAGFMRDYDILSRFGGGEFLIVLPATTLADGLAIAERLRVTIENKPFRISDTENSILRITASMGIATLQAEESLDAFIARVDQALRAAKDRGRNNVTEA